MYNRFKANHGLDNNLNRIINVAEPTLSSDAATKGYIDAVVTGGQVFSQNEAPTESLSTGDQWFKESELVSYLWNGTYWISSQKIASSFRTYTTTETTNSDVFHVTLGTSQNLIERISLTYSFETPIFLDSGNFWNISLYGRPFPYSGNTSLLFSTNIDTNVSATVDYYPEIVTSVPCLILTTTKTGNPSNINPGLIATVTYRTINS